MRGFNRRLFAGGFAVALAAVLGVFVYTSSAVNAGSQLFVLASTTATCQRTGQSAPAGYQDEALGLVLRQFWDDEPVYISFTFPDGRTFSPRVADGRVEPPLGLDGLVDMPPNFPWLAPISNGGDYYYTFQASNRWPYGCYTFTALGARSNRQTQGQFVLIPRSGPAPNAGLASLIVEDNTTGDTSGLHGATVNIFGRGFRAQEQVDVWITAPDGSVLDYPSQFTSDVGSFASTFIFDERFSTGSYAFTALGKSSGYQVIARFNLASRPSTPSGWAQMRVAWRPNASATQTQEFELQGQFFDPFELVSVWATLPDGSVQGLPMQQSNQFGEFFAVVALDQRLPTGVYSFTAEGQASRRLVIGQVTVTAGDPNVTNFAPNPGQAPIVTDSNSLNPNTLGNLPEQTGISTLDPLPEALPDSEPPPLIPTAVPLGPTF
jgi:hypothetical protein